MIGWGDRFVLVLGWFGDFDGWDLVLLVLFLYGFVVSFVLFFFLIVVNVKNLGIFCFW